MLTEVIGIFPDLCLECLINKRKQNDMAVILVVDDEVGIRELLSEILSDEGYSVLLAENAGAARVAINNRHDLVLLDIWMPDNDGVSLLKEWSSTGKLTMPVIMMSGHATLDTAIEATKFGAVDFLEKPIALSRLISSVKSALEKTSVEPKIGTNRAPQPRQPLQPRPQAAYGTYQQPRGDQQAGIAQAKVIDHTHDTLTSMMAAINFDDPLREARDQFERIYFMNLLKRENNSMTKVASAAGLERTHLYRKLKQLGLDVGRAGRSKERTDEFSES